VQAVWQTHLKEIAREYSQKHTKGSDKNTLFHLGESKIKNLRKFFEITGT